MRSLQIAISLISLSCLFAPLQCEAHGGAHGGGPHVASHGGAASYVNGSAANPVRGPLPTGSNGYAYRPFNAGYWGRRSRAGGRFGYNSFSNDFYNGRTYKPVDNSFDDWNRSEIKHLRSLPTSSFIKEYHWAPSPAAGATSQLASKASPAIH